MKANITVSNPDEVAFTLEVTMTLKQWKALRDAIGENGAGADIGFKFKAAIRDMVYQAQKDFQPASEDDD